MLFLAFPGGSYVLGPKDADGPGETPCLPLTGGKDRELGLAMIVLAVDGSLTFGGLFDSRWDAKGMLAIHWSNFLSRRSNASQCEQFAPQVRFRQALLGPPPVAPSRASRISEISFERHAPCEAARPLDRPQARTTGGPDNASPPQPLSTSSTTSDSASSTSTPPWLTAGEDTSPGTRKMS